MASIAHSGTRMPSIVHRDVNLVASEHERCYVGVVKLNYQESEPRYRCPANHILGLSPLWIVSGNKAGQRGSYSRATRVMGKPQSSPWHMTLGSRLDGRQRRHRSVGPMIYAAKGKQ